MAGAFDIKITGNKRLQRSFDNMEKKVQAKLLRPAIRKSVKTVTLPEVRVHVPYKTGNLLSLLKVRARKARGRAGRGSVGSGIFLPGGRSDLYYGRFLEYGTKERYTKSGAYRGEVVETSFLRRGLYSSARRARQYVFGLLRAELPTFVAKMRRAG